MRRFKRLSSGDFFLDSYCCLLGGLALLMIGSFVYGFCKAPYEATKAEVQLQSFLEKHGDEVTVVRIQDELKRELRGKTMATVRRVWFCCQFPDKYTIELEQYHGGDIDQVPLVDEHWKIGIHKTIDSAHFYFKQKVDR